MIQRFDHKEIEAIHRTINNPSGFTDKFLGGEEVMAFEDEFAEYHGCKYGIAVNSGTSALFVALNAIEVDDKVSVPSVGFTADTAMVMASGGRPQFEDIDPFSHCMSEVKETQFALPIHLLGHPCNEDFINKMLEEEMFVVEDCAQACGARYPSGKPVGSLGDVSIFSFQETKHLTTLGEGGMIITNVQEIADVCRSIRNHGEYYKQSSDIGYNFRMTEAQAAVGRVQLKKLPSILNTFKKNMDMIIDGLPPILIPSEIPEGHARMILACKYVGNDRKEYIRKVSEKRKQLFFQKDSDIKGFNQKPGHIVSDGARPQYSIPLYSMFGKECPNAEAYCESAVYIDIHRWRSNDEICSELEILRSCSL